MNHPNWIYSVSIAVLCAYGVVASHAAQNAPTFMSKDGQIQSVNKYSSNPFWSPNSPYNQRIPTPIYATGPDLTTGNCNTVVKTLVASHCAARNNCTDLRISDVRPDIMVQLSQLPGHSYATSCGGYIDSVFENYKKTYGNVSAVNIVYSGNNKANNTLRLTPATYTPTKTETRTAELERLQKETTPGAGIDATLFPKTVDDLSFTDRLANTTVGYEPYKNLESYKTPKFETETEYYERMKPLLEHQITYVNAGAATGCPKTYLTGRGATVSCVPTRDPRSEFVSWCLDAKLTNCAQEHIISPTDRDDKVFYAKWDCISNSVKHGDKCECTDPHMNQYCKCTGIYKPDPSDATRCACVNGADPANNCGTPQITPPSPPYGGCSDPTYMDSNCQCTVVPNSHIDTKTGKCVCDDTSKDISNNCDDACPDPHMDPTDCTCKAPYESDPNTGGCKCDSSHLFGDPDNGCNAPQIPQCLIDASKELQTEITGALSGRTGIIDVNTLRTIGKYGVIADKIFNKCVDQYVSATDLNAFNIWIDDHDTLPFMVISPTGSSQLVNLDAVDVFNSITTNPHYVPLQTANNRFSLQQHITSSDVTAGTDRLCALSGNYTAGCIDFSSTTVLEKVAPALWGSAIRYCVVANSTHWLDGLVMKEWGTLVINEHWAPVNVGTNYVLARQKIKQFYNAVSSAPGDCAGGVTIYMVLILGSWNEGRIKSEPFVVN